MQLSYKTPIWLYPTPVDFRKQINGLVLLVSSELSLLPTSGELFLFRNRRGNQIKLFWYDGNGFWLCHKRLEKGRLCFPAPTLPVMELTHDELSWLLSGLDFKRHRLLPQISAQYFY
jgi:transposase